MAKRKTKETVFFDGHHWASDEEVARLKMLKNLQATGLISGLEYHPKVLLTDAPYKYTADFFYIDKDGTPTHEDFKSGHDDRFRDVVNLWRVYGPTVLVLTRCSYMSDGLRVFDIYDRIIPDRGSDV